MRKLIFIFIAVSLAASAQAQLTNQERMLGQGGTYETHSTSDVKKVFYAFELSEGSEVDSLMGVNRSKITDTVNLKTAMFANDSAVMGGVYFIEKKYKAIIINLGSGKVKLYLD